jgi:hypothetical protein
MTRLKARTQPGAVWEFVGWTWSSRAVIEGSEGVVRVSERLTPTAATT